MFLSVDADICICHFLSFQVSYLIVDEMHNEHPQLIKDQYWDDVEFNLPYTVASEPFRIPTLHLGSALNLKSVGSSVECYFSLKKDSNYVDFNV